MAQEELQSQVEARLGRSLLAGAEAEVIRLSGTIAARQSGFQVELVVWGKDGAKGRRELWADVEDCRAFDAQIVLVIALLIDAQLLVPSVDTPRPPPRSMRAEQKPPPERAVRGPETHARAVVAWGVLPAAAAGVELGVGWGLSRTWAVRGFARQYASQSYELPRKAGASFRLIEAEAQLCAAALRFSRFKLQGCANLAFANLRVQGTGLVPPTARTSLGFAPGLGAELGLHLLAPLWLGVVAGGSAPWIRNRFAYEEPAGQLHPFFRMSAVSLELGAGLGAIFH